MGVAEIADLLGVSRQRVDQLSREPDFPAPLSTLRVGRVWNAGDVEAWIAEHRPEATDEP